MIPTRSASTSASSRYCVVRKTVTPVLAASRATSSQSAVRLWMSSPVVGSSRKRIARPVDEREREVEPALHPAGVAAYLAVGGLRRARRASSSSSAPAPPLVTGAALERRLKPQVLAAGQQRVERRLLERGADRRTHLRALA